MHDFPRQKLCELLAKHGPSLCDDARKLEGLLKDVLRNEHKRETFVLISSLREGVAHELRGSASGMPPAAVAAKLTRQLCDNLALNEAAAQWSVQSWAFALGVEITSLIPVPSKQIAKVNKTRATPVSGGSVDLVAMALHDREKARLDQAKAEADEAIASQIAREAKANAAPVQKEAKRLLEVLPDEPELAREFTNSIGMKFMLIQPGEFTMGSNESIDERPPHLVEITQPFYLGVFPVTQREYVKVRGRNPSRFRINMGQPVESVSLGDAVTFCERLSKLEAGIQHGTCYRLPTEAEWEYACRAGSTGRWCFGDDESLLGDFAWFADNSENQTHPVGLKKPNAWGLYDMHGNVWELCSDYDNNYTTGVQRDPRGPTTGSFRGGCWRLGAPFCRSAFRFKFNHSSPNFILGFRLALSPSGK